MGVLQKFAFDKSSRQIDADGRMHVGSSHISKSTVNPYYGHEIPGYESLGLDPDKVYRLLRDPKELEKAAPTFARLPILKEHVPVTVDSPQPDLVIGSIGSDVTFNAPYLDADLCFWDANAIAGIDADAVKELSCAYRYVPVMTPGTYEGDAYDGVMTQIQGNHLALVEIGRAGSDVVVADHNPFKKGIPAMKMTKLGKALFAALCGVSTKLAQDSALPALFATASKKTFNKADVRAKLLALDASIDSNKLDSILDAILDVEQEDPKPVDPTAAEDESPADKLRQILAGKVDEETMNACLALVGAPAEDEMGEETGLGPTSKGSINGKAIDEKDMKTAMDSAIGHAKKEWRDAEEARRDVRAEVGDVFNIEKAEDVYGFALDQMKVDHKDVTGVPALRALFKVASSNKPVTAPTVIAKDSATAVVKQFPAVARFSQG